MQVAKKQIFFVFQKQLLQIHAPPTSTGDWITIHPNPTSMPTYYGTSLAARESPTTQTTFEADKIVTVCFQTRPNVDNHKGYVAELYQTMGPTSTFEPPTYWLDYSSTYYDNLYIML